MAERSHATGVHIAISRFKFHIADVNFWCGNRGEKVSCQSSAILLGKAVGLALNFQEI